MTSFNTRIFLTVFLLSVVVVGWWILGRGSGGSVGQRKGDDMLQFVEFGPLKIQLKKDDFKILEIDNKIVFSNEKSSEEIGGCFVSPILSSSSFSKIISDAEYNCKIDSECEMVEKEYINKFNREWLKIQYKGSSLNSGIPVFSTVVASTTFSLPFSCQDNDFIESILSSISNI